MRFNSFDYFFFFVIVVGLFFAIPQRFRRPWLLAASLLFYMYWSPVFILLILYSTTIDYFVAKRLQRTERVRTRRGLLALSYVTNFGALFLFKYYDFFMASWAGVARAIGLFQPSRRSSTSSCRSGSRSTPSRRSATRPTSIARATRPNGTTRDCSCSSCSSRS